MRMPETPRLVLTLTVAGLLSGLIIVSVYQWALPIIRANNAAALRRAVFEVLPGAERMQRLVWRDGSLSADGDGEEEGGDANGAGDGDGAAAEEVVYGGYSADGEFVGYAIEGAGAGYQDTIRLLYGYEPAGERVVGMEILESRETPGLGDKIYKDQDFVRQFRDLSVRPKVELVKEEAQAPNQVDAITGATISSATVVSIINAGNATWLERLPPAGEAPPFQPDLEPEAGVETPKGGPVPGGRN